MGPVAIRVAARIGFDAVHQISVRLHEVDFPIELALPYKYDWWLDAVQNFDEMLALLEGAKLDIFTIHATQARISESDFIIWGRQTIKIAELCSAKTITVHPNRAKKNKCNLQEATRIYLRQLGQETPVAISIETFSGNDRIFTPEEIIEAKLPMTLDTAHIVDKNRIENIIDTYWRNIAVLHLSARAQSYWANIKDAPLTSTGRTEHHSPIDPFCIQIVRKLVHLGWSGTIALEYLPWYHYRLRSDITLVQQALVREIEENEIPYPCDKYRDCPDMWGYNVPPPAWEK